MVHLVGEAASRSQTVAWHIWWERLKTFHNEPVQTPHSSAMTVGALVANYTHGKKVVPSGRPYGNEH